MRIARISYLFGVLTHNSLENSCMHWPLPLKHGAEGPHQSASTGIGMATTTAARTSMDAITAIATPITEFMPDS
jgi:hypothetical protein